MQIISPSEEKIVVFVFYDINARVKQKSILILNDKVGYYSTQHFINLRLEWNETSGVN